MATLEIIHFPDPRLKIKSQPVSDFGPKLKRLVADMEETMHWAKGIGLAAIQVAVPQRLLVIDIGDLSSEDEYIEGNAESEQRLSERKTISNVEVFINPEILEASGEIVYEEGCLSVPGVYAKVKRHENLKLRYQDLDGLTHVIETTGLKSIVLQHEIDHLEGIVFPDRLGSLQKTLVLQKYAKLQKQKLREEVE